MTPDSPDKRVSRQAARRASVNVYAIVPQVGLVLGIGLVLFGLASMGFREITDVVPLVVIAAVGGFGLRWLAGQVSPQGDQSFVMRVMVAGLLLRMGLALVIHYHLPDWFFAPDQVTYQDVGWRTLQHHRGLGPLPWQVQNTAEIGHFYWNAFLFSIFGFAPLAAKLANAVIGTGSALLAYRLAGELAGPGPARNALLLTMFFPSLVLWSSLNLRDPVVLFITMGLFLSVVRLRSRLSAMSLFGTILALGSLVLFRDYIAVMAVFGLVGASVIGKARGLPVNLAMGAILFALALLAYRTFGLGSQWVESISFEAIAQQRTNLAVGRTAFQPLAQVNTPLQGLLYLPKGLAFFFFSPFPWQIGSALSLMTLPEQVVWYGLLPTVIIGGLYLIRERYHVFGPILVFVVMTSSVYALVEGNAGTAYRHRSQVLIFFLIMAAVGLELVRLKRKASKPGTVRTRSARVRRAGGTQ